MNWKLEFNFGIILFVPAKIIEVVWQAERGLDSGQFFLSKRIVGSLE